LSYASPGPDARRSGLRTACHDDSCEGMTDDDQRVRVPTGSRYETDVTKREMIVEKMGPRGGRL